MNIEIVLDETMTVFSVTFGIVGIEFQGTRIQQSKRYNKTKTTGISHKLGTQT